MPLRFRKVRYAAGRLPVELDLSVEDGVFLGVTGPDGSGKSILLGLAARAIQPEKGVVDGFETASVAADSLNSADPRQIRASVESALETQPKVLVIGPAFALTDPEYQSGALARLHELRRGGSIIVLASHDLALLERHCDEVAVMEDGRVADRGDPGEVVGRYRARLIERRRQSAAPPEPSPISRHGDERAKVLGVEILGADGRPTALVQSGEVISVRVKLGFLEAVENPVAGILIRSRIGVNVYGTNSELENANIGSCSAGEQVEVDFRFACNLCADQYTLTAASHDPDGAAHDWLEEAIFFAVADTRYTAGFANLRASVEIRKLKAEERAAGPG